MNKKIKITFQGVVEKPLDKHFEAAEKEDKYLSFVANTAIESYKEEDNKIALKCAVDRGKRFEVVQHILSKEPGTATNEDQKKMNDFFLDDSVMFQKSLALRHSKFQEGIQEGKLNLFPGLDQGYLDKGIKYREDSKDTYNDFCLAVFKYDAYIDSLILLENTDNQDNDNDPSDNISSIMELAGDE